MASIAFLGTGALGSGFVKAACERGWEVVVWNRTHEKAEALAEAGARVASTPAEAVEGAARVHLILGDDASVEKVLESAVPGLGADVVICDHTTTQPALTAARVQRLWSEGVSYLHCPVFMGPGAARNAKGTMLVAGNRDLFEKVRENLEQMTGRVAYLGDRPDKAAAVKLMGNALIIGAIGLLADVFSMAQAAGVSTDDALGVLDFVDPATVMKLRGANMKEADFDPAFALTMARKDLRLMLETAGDLPLAVLPGLATRMDELIESGHGDLDLGGLAVDAVQPASEAE